MKEKKIKSLFPFFQNNPEVIFIDSSTTSLKPKSVIDKVSQVLTHNIPILSDLPIPLNKELYEAMGHISKLVGSSRENLYFSQGGTNTLNTIAEMVIDTLKPGDKIILGKLEHGSNVLPWEKQAKKEGVEIIWYELNRETLTIDLNHLKSIVDEKVKVISIAHVYNTIGTTNPVNEVKSIVGNDVLVVVDAIQSVGHIPVNFKELNIDIAVFTAHKMFGLYSSSMVYMKQEVQKKLSPSIWGGKMQSSFSDNSIEVYDSKLKFQAGTQDLPGRVAFGEAARLINELDVNWIHKHSTSLAAEFKKRLKELVNITIYNEDVSSANVMFSVKGALGEDVAYLLATKHNIYLRSGHNCVSTDNGIYKSTRSIRASFYVYNTLEDVEKTISALKEGGDFTDVVFVPREDRKC